MSRSAILIISLFFVGPSVQAQLDLGMGGMQSLWQKNRINPAHQPDEHLTIALPSLFFDFHHSGQPFDDVWSVENETLVIDTRQWLDNLEEQNDVFGVFELPTLEVAWKKDNWSWSIGHSFRNVVNANYSRSIVELLHDGNANYIGDSLFLNSGMKWSSMSAFHVGASWKLDNLTVGGRVHYLNGIQYFETDPAETVLYTDEDVYQLQFNNDIMLRSSSFVTADDLSSLSFEFTGLDAFQVISRNSGFSLDLGAQYRPIEPLMLEVSVLDLGFIQWDEVETYTSQGQFVFEGVEVEGIANFDSLEFEEALDTLGDLFDFQEGRESGFRQTLNSRIFLGAHWQLNDNIGLSVLYRNTSFDDKNFHAWGLGGNVQLTPIWEIGTLVTNRFETWTWGLSSNLKLGVVELFFTSDNVISAFGLGSLSNGNARIGVNLVFGKKEKNGEDSSTSE